MSEEIEKPENPAKLDDVQLDAAVGGATAVDSAGRLILPCFKTIVPCVKVVRPG